MQYLPQITVDISRFLSAVMLVSAHTLPMDTANETEKINKDCSVALYMILRNKGSFIISFMIGWGRQRGSKSDDP